MTMIHNPASANPILRECTYNLFRNNQRPKLFCAVPEDRPIPSFIDAEGWSFECVLRSQDVAPLGFQDRAARAGVRYNGFYLFQVTAREASVGHRLSSAWRKNQKSATEQAANSLFRDNKTGAVAGDAQHAVRTIATKSRCVAHKRP